MQLNQTWLDWDRSAVAGHLENFVMLRLSEEDQKEYFKRNRLHELYLIELVAGLEKFDWKWLHDHGKLCVNDYMVFDELAEWKDEVIARHEVICKRLEEQFPEVEDGSQTSNSDA
jgi:hypothetical protein